jgi:hypothetical protein
MKKLLFILTILLILISWQCSKIDQSKRNLTVKESIENSVAGINTAIEKISGSIGYSMLSLSEGDSKSETGFQDSIDLDLIAGIYEFSPDTNLRPYHFFPYKLFKRTGTSNNLEVNLPEQMVLHPKRLHFYIKSDPVPENNFKITATGYHFYHNWWRTYDYNLESGFSLDGENVGNMKTSSAWKSYSERNYLNSFTFPEGYTLLRSGQTGNPARFVFALAKGNDTLLKETLSFSGDGFNRKEKQYILSVGDVDIKRATGIDSIQVYLNGVLQKKAGAKIMYEADYEASIFSRRDILLTFDDGTQAKLSELISPALETLKTLSRSLEEMYFSRHIVDYIAFNIYYSKQ